MSMSPTKMTPREHRAAFSIAGIYTLRMLGLFMILPVFALYAESLGEVTPVQIGLAIGIYGLTQAVLQIPFGMLSDRFGRKPIITIGLLIFAAGSAIAAMSTTIEGIIFGRAIQGAGAIAAALMALAADLTHEEHRAKAMAVIGITIGLSFVAAMVLGPLLSNWVGVPGIFWFTSILALAGIGVLYLIVPDPIHITMHRDTEPVPAQFKQVLTDTQLLRLDFGIMVLHMVLTASFVVLPLALRDTGFAPEQHWLLYLPVMVFAFAASIPFIIIAEVKQRMKQVFLYAIAILALCQFAFIEWHSNVWILGLLIWLFFSAFNLLEATLPSLIAKIAPVQSKGTAMGVYSSSQFIGAFIGGAGGGALYGLYGFNGVFLFCAVILLLWLSFAASMREPRYISTFLINVGDINTEQARQLETEISQVNGVAEVTVNEEDGVAYLKIDPKVTESDDLLKFSAVDPNVD